MRVPQVSERIKEAPAQALRGVFAGIGQLLLVTDRLRHKTPADQDVPRARTPETAETVTDTPVTSPAGAPGETVATTAPPATATPPADPEPADAQAAAAEPAAAEPAADAGTAEAPKPSKRQSTRNFDKTGNVRLIGDEAGSPSPGTAAPQVAVPEPAAVAGPIPAGPIPAEPIPAEPIPAEPIAKPEPIATFEPTVVAEPVAAPEPVIVSEAAAPEPVVAAAPVAAPVTAAEPVSVAGPPLPNYDALTVPSLRARLRNLDITQVRQLAEYERAHAGRADVLGMYERRIARLEAEA